MIQYVQTAVSVDAYYPPVQFDGATERVPPSDQTSAVVALPPIPSLLAMSLVLNGTFDSAQLMLNIRALHAQVHATFLGFAKSQAAK